jgi:L-xylulokinase
MTSQEVDLSTTKSCYIGIDVGLTAAKAAAFDADGRELRVARADNPRAALDPNSQEIDMVGLIDVVHAVLQELTAWLNDNSYLPTAVGVTGHGNGLYLVDENLRPVRSAFASTDSRAEDIVASISDQDRELNHAITGSYPWAGQPAILLSWLSRHEPVVLRRCRWVFTCKDWITSQLTGVASADYSDASACGIVNLATRKYERSVLRMLGIDDVFEKLPQLSNSSDIVGQITLEAASQTGLPIGTPVVAGCMDCVASPIGVGSTNAADVTIIVGTWAINSAVVPSTMVPPKVTLNALLPDPAFMLAQEVAPTSAASVEWFAALASGAAGRRFAAPDILAAAENAPAGADGVLFLPFVHGAPDYFAASGAFIGAKDSHGFAHLSRAVVEGVVQYHRVQVEKLLQSGADISDAPWTLTGGGARNLLWAQIFADTLNHPVRRQLGTELGARGVASLAYRGLGQSADHWLQAPDPSLIVYPGKNRERYQRLSQTFDRVLGAMQGVWDAAQDGVPIGHVPEQHPALLYPVAVSSPPKLPSVIKDE